MSDFDRVISRQNTNALAVEGYADYLFKEGGETLNLRHGRADLISMWVADMAFASPAAAIDAMAERLRHPIFGYTMNFDDGYYDAFSAWSRKLYGWTFPREALLVSTGVIPALFDLIDQICGPDEKVLTLTPAYAYFKHAADHHRRELVTCSLQVVGEDHTIDFEDLRRKVADPKIRLLFFCHPHNPTGRAWTDDELRRVGEICLENEVIVISDEVHCDLLRHGKKHTPLAKLFPDSDHIITCMAPSKTFNLAGLMTANVIIPSPKWRSMWRERTQPIVNPISLAAAQGVYENGFDWLQSLRSYLDANFTLLERELNENLSRAIFKIPEATYLAWVDLGAYFPSSMNLTRFFLEEAGVILEGGEMFVADGGTRVRLNVACPRSTLREALIRLFRAIEDFGRNE